MPSMVGISVTSSLPQVLRVLDLARSLVLWTPGSCWCGHCSARHGQHLALLRLGYGLVAGPGLAALQAQLGHLLWPILRHACWYGLPHPPLLRVLAAFSGPGSWLCPPVAVALLGCNQRVPHPEAAESEDCRALATANVTLAGGPPAQPVVAAALCAASPLRSDARAAWAFQLSLAVCAQRRAGLRAALAGPEWRARTSLAPSSPGWAPTRARLLSRPALASCRNGLMAGHADRRARPLASRVVVQAVHQQLVVVSEEWQQPREAPLPLAAASCLLERRVQPSLSPAHKGCWQAAVPHAAITHRRCCCRPAHRQHPAALAAGSPRRRLQDCRLASSAALHRRHQGCLGQVRRPSAPRVGVSLYPV